jgi:ribonucleoside-diphosphate reductase alpha chain
LAREGAVPVVRRQQYLATPRFASRLPEEIKAAIRQHGMRNSHLTAIAPTGTISLAFADNASNGIEPAFSWFYTRKKRMADDTRQEYPVEDHAYRVFKHLNGIDDEVTVLPFDAARSLPPGVIWAEPDGQRYAMLPAYFVTALEMSAQDHLRMSAAVHVRRPAINKTVNVPADYRS